MNIRERAIRFAVEVIRTGIHWQEVEHAFANHPEYGPWMEESGDPIAEAQAIIAEAEERVTAIRQQ